MDLVKAVGKDYIWLLDLHTRCTRDLDRQGIYQWTPEYPGPKTIKAAIASGCQWLFKYHEDFIGGVVLNEDQDPEWKTIDWTFEGKILVIHSLVIDKAFQGKGLGQMALDAIEVYAREEGYIGIRMDVFSENPGAIYLYEKNGYTFLGDVFFQSKPKGHERYICLEKKFL